MENNQNLIEQDSDQLLVASLLERLGLTPEMRIEAHENARKLVADLYEAGKNLNARSQEAS